MKNWIAVLAVLVVGLTAACGGGGGVSGPSAPPMSLNGNYSGTAQDQYGISTLKLTLAQSGASVTGTYVVTDPTGTAGGSFAGTLTGNSLAGKLAPADSFNCPYNLTGTVAGSGATISGSYTSYDCSVTFTGTFTVAR